MTATAASTAGPPPGPPADPASADEARPASTVPGLTVLVVVGLVVAGVIVVAPAQYGLLVLMAAIALVAVVLGLASPALAAAYLLVSAFLRQALPTGPLPTDAFVLAFGGLLAALLIRRVQGARSAPVGRVGYVVAAYVAWTVFSAVSAHVYDPVFPSDGTEIDVFRFVLVGTVMPLVVLLVGIAVLSRPGAVEVLVRTTLLIGGYSAYVSIMQFHGPTALIWPSYAAGSDVWVGRAIGVVNQPAAHGLLLVVGYVVALMVASEPWRARTTRVGAALLALACAYSVFLTYTRAVYVALALVVVLGAWLARGWRTGFVLTGLVGLAGAAVNFASLATTSRETGGIGSTNEIDDRLNINATGVWATLREPLTGWGIGRFGAVNTYHHQQFSPEIPWERGYGIAAHNDLLAVSSELGLVGAALWLTIVVVVAVRLVRGLRLTSADPTRARLVLAALLAYVSWIVSGLLVDQRFFDVSNLLVLALVGAAIGAAERTLVPRARPERPSPPDRSVTT